MNAVVSGVGLSALIVMGGCATTQPVSCAADFAGGVCLDMSQAGSLVSVQAVVEEEVARTLDAVRPLLGVRDLRISVVADPSGVIPEIGLGGFNPSDEEVRLFADPAWPNLEAVLRAELLSILAHEMHHAMRRRSVGYGSTLFQAAVTEGLADHFALEVEPRDPPPWSTALADEELADWTSEVLSRTSGGYDHGAWFLGTDPSIPRWTGYAVGFDLVGRFRDGDPRSASELVGEPAASFLPPPGGG